MIEERIAWIATMLDDEGRKKLLEYAELLFVEQIAAEETEEGLGVFVPASEPANDREARAQRSTTMVPRSSP